MTQVVGALNPLWTAPYTDPDEASYGETPSAREFELRAAATPAGSGSLIIRRCDVAQILDSFRTGEQLDPLSSTSGTAADANTTAATYSATHPTGYSGNHLEVQATGASSTTRGVRKLCAAGAKDLTVYAGGSRIRVWWRITSNTNLTRWVIRFEFATTGDWAEYTLALTGATINTWTEANVAKDNPVATNGTVDWSLWSGNVWIGVRASGAYTGNCELADHRIGITRTGKTVPDGDLAAESSYDARVRYRDNATPKASTTTAAASIVGATNIKMTSVTGIAIGDWLTIATTGAVESRLVTAVGTAGGGGTGVDVDAGYTYAHGSGDTAAVYYWGAWTAWLTDKFSIAPTVAANTPADAATVTDPTQDLAHTFSSPGGKAQASHTYRVYLRTTQDALIYELETDGTGLTDTIPRFLLDPALTYAWEKDAADTDELVGTTTRRSFTTSFATQAPVTDLAATVDTDASAILLGYTLPVSFDHIRVYWVAADGTWLRVDGGPAELDDGLTPLTAATFTYYGGRHGLNEFWVTAHNGAASDGESEAVYVAVTLDPISDDDLSSVVVDGDPGFTFPLRVEGPARTRRSGIETFTPPGRGTAVHLNWGNGGKQITVTVRYRPAVDGDLVTLLDTLMDDGTPFWFKFSETYAWDPLRALVVGLQDAAQDWGFSQLSVDLDESEDRP